MVREFERLKQELEASKARLAEAESQLASTREQYSRLYNLAPVGHLTVDASGAIRQTNDTALEVFGEARQSLIGQNIADFIADIDQQAFTQFKTKLFNQDDVHIAELRLERPDGSVVFTELRGRRVLRGDAQTTLGFIVVANVTERREMDEALKERNRELAILNQFARTVGDSLELADVITALEAMLQQDVGIAAGAIFNYDSAHDGLYLTRSWGSLPFLERFSEELVQGSELGQIAPDHMPVYIADLRDFSALTKRVQPDELPEKQASIFASMVARGRLEGALWLFDSSERPITEEYLSYVNTLAQQAGVAMRSARLFAELRYGRERLQLLTRQIVQAQEEERRRVARELHDEAGQLLTALKLSLEMLDEDLRAAKDDQAALQWGQNQLASAISLSERTMAHIRGLVHNLRPTALDDLGLNSALEGLCHDFARRRDVLVEYHSNVEETLSLSGAVQIVAYRFLQEALTNVSKHAQATEVVVSVEKRSQNICLSVADNGVGFDMHPTTEGLGILGMRERLESVGGTLDICSRPNDGATLVATIPSDS